MTRENAIHVTRSNYMGNNKVYQYTASDISSFLTGLALLLAAVIFICQLLYSINNTYLRAHIDENYIIIIVKFSFLLFSVISFCAYICTKKYFHLKFNFIDLAILILMFCEVLIFFKIYKFKEYPWVIFFIAICLFLSFFYELYILASIDFLGKILTFLFLFMILICEYFISSNYDIQSITIETKNGKSYNATQYSVDGEYIFINAEGTNYILPFLDVKTIVLEKERGTTTFNIVK